MIIETIGKAMELLNRALPYPEQIKNIDLEKEDAIYFDWRSSRYKLDLEFCQVEKSNKYVTQGDNCSILMTELLKKQLIFDTFKN